MTDTNNLDSNEIIDILFKNNLEFTTTDTTKQWYEESRIPYNNYLLGDELFIDSIPQNPDFDINGTVVNAEDIGLISGDFIYYNNNPFNKSICSIVDDSTGTVRRFRYLKLDPVPETNVENTSWYKIERGESKEIITKNSFQFTYNQFLSGDILIQPYLSAIYTEQSVRTDDLLPFGNEGGNNIFNFKTGILLFTDLQNFDSGIVDSKFRVSYNNKPVLTFYKYIGKIGINELTLVGANSNKVEFSNIFTQTDRLILTTDWVDCSDILYKNIIPTNNNKKLLVSINFNYKCSVAYQERISIRVVRSNQYTNLILKENTNLGPLNAAGEFIGNYSCNFIDLPNTNLLIKYYIIFKLETNDSEVPQGIININTDSNLGSSSITIIEM